MLVNRYTGTRRGPRLGTSIRPGGKSWKRKRLSTDESYLEARDATMVTWNEEEPSNSSSRQRRSRRFATGSPSAVRLITSHVFAFVSAVPAVHMSLTRIGKGGCGVSTSVPMVAYGSCGLYMSLAEVGHRLMRVFMSMAKVGNAA